MKYNNITVQLSDQDGNAFFILGRCSTAMRRVGCSKEEINQFTKEATQGSYENLLKTCHKYFNCE